MNAAHRRVVLVSEIARLGQEQLNGLEVGFQLIERYDLDNVRDQDLDSVRTRLTKAADGALPEGCLNPEAWDTLRQQP